MRGPDTTWGDVREIYKQSLEQPDRKFEDNILVDPEIRAFSEGRPDNELIRSPGKLTGPPPEEDAEEGLGDEVEFNLLIDGDSVKMLTRSDFEGGSMQYRSGSEWVDITPDDVIPFLDELPNTRVTGQAVDIWDDDGDDPQKDDFNDVLMDDVD